MPYSIDFETFYSTQYTIKKMGVIEYVQDERFDPYLVSIVGPEPNMGLCYVGHPKDAPWDRIGGDLWVSHNAGFDQRVFLRAQEMGLIPAHIVAPTWHCSADLATYLQMPRDLQGAVKQFFNEDISKQVRANMKDRRLHELTPDERIALDLYALDDARWSLRIWQEHQAEWPDLEKTLAIHTRLAGMRGVYVDQDKLGESIWKLDAIKRSAAALLPWNGSAPPTSILALRAACQAAGIHAPLSTAEDDARCVAWELEYGATVPWVAALRTWRKANRAQKVLETMLRRTDPKTGLMQYALKYFGAGATGRWSGDAGLNMQNLPRLEQDGVDIRKCVVAPPGKTFVCCDLSQIEPRVLAWLCGDQAMLDQMAGGMDLYEAHARATMRYTDPRPLKEANPQMRLLSKIRCLGLGYGCGPDKFILVAAGYDVTLTRKEAVEIVDDYRDSNPRILAFWHRLYRDFKSSCEHDYLMELPNGRTMRYFHVQARMGGMASIVRGQHPRHWYGGKLAENATQAVARDVFAAAYGRVLQAGFDVSWSVHDELIIPVKERHATQVAEEITRLMSETPDWMPGLPVAASATITPHYTK